MSLSNYSSWILSLHFSTPLPSSPFSSSFLPWINKCRFQLYVGGVINFSPIIRCPYTHLRMHVTCNLNQQQRNERSMWVISALHEIWVALLTYLRVPEATTEQQEEEEVNLTWSLPAADSIVIWHSTIPSHIQCRQLLHSLCHTQTHAWRVVEEWDDDNETHVINLPSNDLSLTPPPPSSCDCE